MHAGKSYLSSDGSVWPVPLLGILATFNAWVGRESRCSSAEWLNSEEFSCDCHFSRIFRGSKALWQDYIILQYINQYIYIYDIKAYNSLNKAGDVFWGSVAAKGEVGPVNPYLYPKNPWTLRWRVWTCVFLGPRNSHLHQDSQGLKTRATLTFCSTNTPKKVINTCAKSSFPFLGINSFAENPLISH